MRVKFRRIAGLVALALGFAGGMAGAGEVAAPPPPAPTLPVEEARRGQRGYGLSVFEGDQVERFEVEVLGVMRNVSPETSYILARLSGRGLERTGVIAGMSGSPVYIDGRLAGAVAFAWPFSDEAIAGITPIASMHDLARPRPPAAPAASGLTDFEGLRRLAAGRLSPELLEERLAALAAPAAAGAAPTVQWAASGFGGEALALLERRLARVAPAGGAAEGTLAPLAPGTAVAAMLVDGDLRLAAVGTVTDRTADEVFAFGHPFLAVGPLEMPMAPAEVVTVVSSRFSSFKVANFGAPVGAFDQDRLAGLHGVVGRAADLLPVAVRTAGRDYRMRVARLPPYLPLLVAVSALGSMEAGGHLNGPQGIDLVARFRLRDYGDLELRQSFDGDQAAVRGAVYVLAVTAFLTQNRLEEVTLESVELDFDHFPAPRTAALVGAHADRTLVRPGDTIELNLDLVAYRGAPFRRSLPVALPADLPSGTYSLLVGDGASIDAMRLALEPAAPVDFGQALRILRSLHANRELVVLGVYGGRGLAVAGRVLPRLPASVRSLFGSATSGSALPLRLAVAQEEVQESAVPIDGAVRIDLEVRRRETVSAEGDVETPAPKPQTTAPAPPAAAKPAARPPGSGGGR